MGPVYTNKAAKVETAKAPYGPGPVMTDPPENRCCRTQVCVPDAQ